MRAVSEKEVQKWIKSGLRPEVPPWWDYIPKSQRPIFRRQCYGVVSQYTVEPRGSGAGVILLTTNTRIAG